MATEEASPPPPRRERQWPWIAGTAVLVVAASVWAISGHLHDRGWTKVASLGEVSSRGVIYLADQEAFVVSTPAGPIALSQVSPDRGTRLLFCRSSGLFEGVHGEKFDRFGTYFAGPAPRSMDRIELRIEGELVALNPSRVEAGGDRSDATALNAEGDFCPDGVESPTEPGFAADPE